MGMFDGFDQFLGTAPVDTSTTFGPFQPGADAGWFQRNLGNPMEAYTKRLQGGGAGGGMNNMAQFAAMMAPQAPKWVNFGPKAAPQQAGMGGALGMMGGDLGGIAFSPAGNIGILRSLLGGK